ncbi:MAG: TSUP family transporter [Deltaproteobacteria bacterium]|nr:TSUP family transporter [Deltaproteobacteria bacterium]
MVDAIAGGGGLISLPAYLAAGLPPHVALATNKFSSTVGTLGAALRYLRAGQVHPSSALAAAAGALAGAALGARLVLLVPDRIVHLVVLVLVPSAAAVLLGRDRLLARWRPRPGLGIGGALGMGLAVGLYDGFFGPGTGTFLTIGFHVLVGLPLLVAAGNARLVNLASNVGALVVFLLEGRVAFPLAWAVGLAGILGNQVGSSLALRKGERVVRGFLVVVLVLLLAEVLRRRVAGA